MSRIKHAMTVDVEDYFHVSAFERLIPKEKWSTHPFRVQANTERILKIFDEAKIKATFFILGWVAERCPQLVRAIALQGHEIACHSYYHQRVDTLTPNTFRQDCTQSKHLLEDIIQAPVFGYRAPSFSINPRTPWAHQILEEVGFVYSSSVYPIRHDHYGWPKAPRFTFTATPGGLVEIPMSTLRLRMNLPCSGGGYFRLYPYGLTKRMFLKIEQEENKPCIFYFHPWEIDEKQPRIKGLPLKSKFRHYINLKRTQPRLERLVKDFNWDTMYNVFIKGQDIRVKSGRHACPHQAA